MLVSGLPVNRKCYTPDSSRWISLDFSQVMPMPRDPIYALGLILIAIASLETATTGKLRLLRGSDRGWKVSIKARLLFLLVGIVTAVAGIVVFIRFR